MVRFNRCVARRQQCGPKRALVVNKMVSVVVDPLPCLSSQGNRQTWSMGKFDSVKRIFGTCFGTATSAEALPRLSGACLPG
jgi:hypothetical protein